MGLSSIGAWAQERPTANYELAARFSPEKVRKMVHSTDVRPNWFQSSDGFWYEYQTSEGKNWYIVDPNNRSKRPLFDRDALAAAITIQVQDPFDGQNLPIQDLKFLEAENALRFKVRSTKEVVKKNWEEIKRKDRSAKDSLEKKTFFFRYDLRTRELTEIEDYEEKEKRLSWANIAPDSSKIVFAKHYNLYWMDKENFLKAIKDEKDSTIVEHQLTEDGEKYFEWGGASRGEDNVEEEKNKDNRKRAGVLWAPNSASFIVTRTDSRHVKDLWVLHNIRNPRPTLETYKYAMPGEKEQPQTTLHQYRFEGEEMRTLPVQTYKDQSLGVYSLSYPIEQADEAFKPVVWLGDDSGFYFSITSRDLKRIDICRWDLQADEKKVLVEERSNTYIEIKKPYLVNNGRQFIHWSERDGWAHLYLYSSEGTLIRRLTEGPYHVENVETVDERSKTVFFTANAKEKGEDPYYEHLYSVSLEGGQPRLLNAGDFQHNTSIKTNGKFFVNNYSRVNTVPKSDLHNARGERVMSLEEADLSQLFAAGYQFPEPFKVKADDGITDLYGVMYKPFDFDSTKHYPIIQYVYPGPQTEAVNKSWSRGMDRTDRLAQLGFVVVTVGNRGGHPNRSKWYHNYGYGNLRDYGLADKKAAAEQLADRHAYIDVSKVGIHGHSGGGFMSTAAMLVYPDFFKVAVSSAGNHENNIYNRWWSEKHHGVTERVSPKGDTTFVYQIEKNPDLAKNLKGHLLLVTGDVDNNVHPAGTIRMANALIQANKRFDFILLPGQRHGFGNMTEYFFWRMGDYFVRHLLEDTSTPPVDMLEIQRERAQRR